MDSDFTKDDFEKVLQIIRNLAGNYDRGHPAAPSLKGFSGASMSPAEFKVGMSPCTMCEFALGAQR